MHNAKKPAHAGFFYKYCMFGPITIPQTAVMLFNEVYLRDGVTVDDIEEVLAEMCSVVKENYAGFIAGQVFEFAGFVSAEGSIGRQNPHGGQTRNTVAIVTYWTSFEEHERSHADELFKSKFNQLVEFSISSTEHGYRNLWQGQK